MNNVVFTKQYTRDSCLIIQEIWAKELMVDIDNNHNPYSPANLYYMHNGVIEIWDNNRAIEWYKDKLLKRNQKDKNFLVQSINKYNTLLGEINKYKAQGHLNSKRELINFLELLRQATKYFLVFYFTALNKKSPKNKVQIAMAAREKDSLYDDANKIIVQSIDHIFPKIKGLGASLGLKDLDNRIDPDIIKQRWDNYVVIVDKYYETDSLKNFAKRHPEYIIKLAKVNSDIKEIKGSIANKGRTQGKVIIVRKKDQLQNVRSGEIIVSPMTTPDYLSAMKIAAGFVTDEGGIICHAVIISRELNKPCIIGTKIATQVLKDGDLVEVDADRGVVRRIKNLCGK